MLPAVVSGTHSRCAQKFASLAGQMHELALELRQTRRENRELRLLLRLQMGALRDFVGCLSGLLSAPGPGLAPGPLPASAPAGYSAAADRAAAALSQLESRAGALWPAPASSQRPHLSSDHPASDRRSSAPAGLSSASGRRSSARVTMSRYAAPHDETSPAAALHRAAHGTDRRERKRRIRQSSQSQPRPESPEEVRLAPLLLPGPLQQEHQVTNLLDPKAAPSAPPGIEGHGEARLRAPDEDGSREAGCRGADRTAFNGDRDNAEDEPVSGDKDQPGEGLPGEDNSPEHVWSTTHPNSPPQRSETATGRSRLPWFSQTITDARKYWLKLASVSEAWIQYKKGAASIMPPLEQLEKATDGRWRHFDDPTKKISARRWFNSRKNIAMYVEEIAERAECSPEDVCKVLDDKFHRNCGLLAKILADGEDPMTIDLDQVQGKKGKQRARAMP